jgi:hypothetical protein
MLSSARLFEVLIDEAATQNRGLSASKIEYRTRLTCCHIRRVQKFLMRVQAGIHE